MATKRKYDPVKRRAAYLRAKERATALGFTSPSARTRANRKARLFGISTEDVQRLAILAKWGITTDVFNAMRRRNLAHTPEGSGRDGRPGSQGARQIQTYRVDIDEDDHNWSDARVGYIVSFFWAVSSPATNYFSLPRTEREQYYFLPEPKLVPSGIRKWTDREYVYLVRYGGFMDIEEFDSRYGDGGPLSRRILTGTL